MSQKDIVRVSEALGPASSETHPTSIETSRATAVNRVFRGGLLAVLGAWVALLPDGLNWSGLPLLVISGAGIAGLAAGAVWASLGAKHLLRYGKSGSSLALVSITGLAGSSLLWIATFYLLTDGPSSLWSALSIAALVGTLGFGTIVLLTVLLWVVRMLTADDGE